ncbi:UNVERIFIED_CONTAM: dockerin type I repeat protein [Acetivibrio alkalicellulosi]
MKKFFMCTLAFCVLFQSYFHIEGFYSGNSAISEELLSQIEATYTTSDVAKFDQKLPNLYRNIDFATESLNSTAYGNGAFVIVSNNGIIKASCDGNVWTNIYSGKPNNLNNVIWTGDSFIAVGEKGTIITSKDGFNWELKKTDIQNTLYGVASSESLLVAVGENGLILTSTNGEEWIREISGVENTLKGVTIGNDKIIAVGERIIVISQDGKSWTKKHLDRNDWLNAVTWNGNMFVAVGGSDMLSNSNFSGSDLLETMALPPWSDWVMYSYDGEHWFESLYVEQGGSVYRDVFWDGDRFIASAGNFWSTSVDGITWRKTQSTNAVFSSISYDGKKYITVGLTGHISVSQDCINWTVIERDKKSRFVDINFNENKYLITGWFDEPNYSGNFVTLTSNNGIDWTMNKYPTDRFGSSNISNVIDCNRNFYGIRNGNFVVSSDGVVWDDIYDDIGKPSIVWTGDGFSGVHNTIENGEKSAYFITSIDGTQWTKTKISDVGNLSAFNWMGKYYIAQEQYDYTKIMVSINGLEWEDIYFEDGNSYMVTGAAFSDDVCVVGVSSGKVLISKDGGKKWCMVETGLELYSNRIYYDGTRFIRLGTNGFISSSLDGETWVICESGFNYISGLIYDGSKHILVEFNGTILYGSLFESIEQDSDFLYGDLNGDGVVDSIDYVYLKRYILGIGNTVYTDDWKRAADLNMDGSINSLDCVILKRFLLEIISEIPISS